MANPFDVHGTDSSNSGDEDASDDLLDIQDISTYWKDKIDAMTDPPIGWPLESYTRCEETEFITTALKKAADGMKMNRVLVPNQYPYDIMYCLFVVRPNDTLKTCQENMRGTYKETIAYLFSELGLRRDFSCVEFTLATNTVSQRFYSDAGHDRYKFVIYQTNSEDDIFHVELWRSQTNVSECRRSERSLYMRWYSAMHNRTKALAWQLLGSDLSINLIYHKCAHMVLSY